MENRLTYLLIGIIAVLIGIIIIKDNNDLSHHIDNYNTIKDYKQRVKLYELQKESLYKQIIEIQQINDSLISRFEQHQTYTDSILKTNKISHNEKLNKIDNIKHWTNAKRDTFWTREFTRTDSIISPN